MVRTLADRLDKVAGELRKIFGDSLLVSSPHAKDFRRLAIDLQKGARVLRQMPVPSAERVFSYRTFLKHIPIVMLCNELQVPHSVSFEEIEQLLYVAARVRGLKRMPADRSVEMQVNRLRKRPTGRSIDGIAEVLLRALTPS
jgi:hypothetical protein